MHDKNSQKSKLSWRNRGSSNADWVQSRSRPSPSSEWLLTGKLLASTITSGDGSDYFPTCIRSQTLRLWMLLPLFFAMAAVAGEPTISLSVTPKSASLGQPIRCEWTVAAPLAAEITFPDHLPPMTNLQVLERIQTPTQPKNGQQVTQLIVIAEAIDAADAAVPEIEVHIRQSGISQTLKSAAVTLPFASVLTGSEELQDIRADVLPWSPQTIMLAGVIAVILIVVIIALLMKPRAPKPADSAISATDGAAAIRAVDVEQPTYDFYEAVNSILARYLKTRYKITARPTTAGICQEVGRASKVANSADLSALVAILSDDDTRRYKAGSEQDAERRYAETVAVWLDQQARAGAS